MRCRLVVLLSLIFFNFIQSQERLTVQQIDSLTDVLYNKKNQLFNDKGLVLAKELLAQSKDIDYKKGQIRSLLKIVDIKIAQSNFQSGYGYLKTLKKLSINNQDYFHYVSALGIESKLYFNEGNYDKASKILTLAKSYLPYIKNDDERLNTKIVTNIYLWYAIRSSKNTSIKQVLKMSFIAKELYIDSRSLKDGKKRLDRILMACNLLVNSLILEKKFKEAYIYQKEAEKYVTKIGLKSISGVDYLRAKADLLYFDKNRSDYNVDEVISAYKKALKVGESLNYFAAINEIYPNMAKLYGEKNDYPNQVLYLQKSNALQNDLNERNKNGFQELREVLYETNKISNASQNKPNDKINYWILSIIVLLPSCYYGYRFNKNRKKTAKNSVSVEGNLNVVPSDAISNLLTLAHEKNSGFLLSFMGVYPDFAESLVDINPAMKSTDIEFCAYIKLNLDTKQIAVIKNMSVRAVEGKKYRIRKKLDIPTDENMYLWISKI